MKNRGGLTLTEVLITGSLGILLLVSAQTIIQYLSQSSARMANRVEPRQQLRSLIRLLQADFQSASYLFLGESRVWGMIPLAVPTAGNSGEQLLYAIPSDASPNTDYTVCMLYPRLRNKQDPNNPQARELVYHRFLPCKAPIANVPSSLLPNVVVGGSDRTFDAYLSSSPFTSTDPGWSIQVSPNGRGIRIQAHFVVAPQRGAVVDERFETFVTMRNDV